jgi:sugar phosphate isomerase/epimerase
MITPTTRRTMLSACLTSIPALAALPLGAAETSSCGLVIHSFAVRTAADRTLPPRERFSNPDRFLAHARSLGAAGVQVSIGIREDRDAEALRSNAEAASMFLEGIVSLPRDDADLDRFEAELRTAKRAGAKVVRTVMLQGRRYETFASAAAFRKFAEESWHSLFLAGPVVARQDIRLAVENHKDWRADELIGLLKRLGNDHVGVCLDTGNSIALLEDPMDVIEALAPRAFTTHFKDMGLEEYRDGFLLAEVPLGTGVLDLPRAVRLLRATAPDLHFNIEMITRDPLQVPCVTSRYWETFPDLAGRHLARALRLVRDHPPDRRLPRISLLPQNDKLRAEADNVRECLDFARSRLGL